MAVLVLSGALSIVPGMAYAVCGFGDWGKVYYMAINHTACSYTVYAVSCGGLFGTDETWNEIGTFLTAPTCRLV